MNPSQAGTDQIYEQDLVERLKKGQAFDHLVRTYQGRLIKIAYGITLDREESQEVVQDVFVSVFKNIQTFRQDASLSTWLRKITIHHCLNWKRKWTRRFKWHHDPIEPEMDPGLLKENTNNRDPEMLFREKQLETHLMEAVRSLPEKTRLVFVLNALEGLSYEEIADTLNIKKGTVSSRLYFARKSLINDLKMSEQK